MNSIKPETKSTLHQQVSPLLQAKEKQKKSQSSHITRKGIKLFQDMLLGHLENSSCSEHITGSKELDNKYPQMHRISGTIKTNIVSASIRIYFSGKIKSFCKYPPIVFCNEPWMRHGAEWHNSAEDGMCWMLHEQWRDIQSIKRKSHKLVAEDGFNLLVKSVESLINRHHYCHKYGHTKWPEHWPAWGHGPEGVREYELQKMRKR